MKAYPAAAGLGPTEMGQSRHSDRRQITSDLPDTQTFWACFGMSQRCPEAQAGFDPPRRASEFLARLLLQREHAEIERDGIEAAGEDNARAGPFRLFVMGVDHAPPPSRFSAQINKSRARRRARHHK